MKRCGRSALYHVFLFLLFLPGSLESVPAQESVEFPPLPRGYRGIKLGMGVSEVKEALLEDPYFRYRGDPDVSLVNRPNQSLIEVEGYSFIKRAFFQFHEGRLYAMILVLDEDRIDHYTMYTSLRRKYGDETSLSPGDVVWESAETRLSLERPITVKYIDRPVFTRLAEAGRAVESQGNLTRDTFVGEF